jgi:hypothetical protein
MRTKLANGFGNILRILMVSVKTVFVIVLFPIILGTKYFALAVVAEKKSKKFSKKPKKLLDIALKIWYNA